MASSDINPNFITSTPVDKATMRQQLQYIKDCIQALEAQGNWKQVSSVALAAPATEIRVNLPTGYARYRVEFQDMRGTTNGSVQMRASLNSGSSFVTGGTDYIGVLHDYYGTGNLDSSFTSDSIALFQQSATEVGGFGTIDMPFQGARGHMEASFINTTPVRVHRSMFFSINATPVNMLQFFCQNFTVPLQTGCVVQVMAR